MTPILFRLVLLCMTHQPNDMQEIRLNNMSVKWEIEKGAIHFQLRAPTKGWMAIGFNETTSLSGTYLLMARVRNGQAEVVEHHVKSPGNYKPLQYYGVVEQVEIGKGEETEKSSVLNFSIPIHAGSRYHKELLPGSLWTLTMAYSLEDDFQHHSIMRTSTQITL